ncbi:ATP-binding protein, partial [Chloroflexota bacterium]
GPAHVGKMTLALNLAQALNCQADEAPCGECASCRKIASFRHADVQITVLNDETSEENRAKIGVSQIDEIQHSASLPPFEGEYKVFIIDGAEFLSTGAANRLLKTLEEPEGKVIFILLTINERLILPTVLSRCQRIELSPIPVNEIETVLINIWATEPEKALLLARLSHGCLGWAISAALDDNLTQQRNELLDGLLDVTGGDGEDRFDYAAQLATRFGQNRETVYQRLELWLEWWRDLLMVKAGLMENITNIDRSDLLSEIEKNYNLAQIRAFIQNIRAAGEQLRQNANPRLVLEVLMLNVPEMGKFQKIKSV